MTLPTVYRLARMSSMMHCTLCSESDPVQNFPSGLGWTHRRHPDKRLTIQLLDVANILNDRMRILPFFNCWIHPRVTCERAAWFLMLEVCACMCVHVCVHMSAHACVHVCTGTYLLTWCRQWSTYWGQAWSLLSSALISLTGKGLIPAQRGERGMCHPCLPALT